MSGSDKRQRGGERREQILEVALQLFAQHGMAHVSTRQIAQAVGISQPSLYAHFRTAHEISAELCIRAFETLYRRSIEVMAQPGTPLEQFRRLGRAYVDFGLDHPDMYRLAFMLEPPEAVSALVQQGKDPAMEAGESAFGVLRTVLARMLDADDETVELNAQSIWASVHGLTSLLIARPHFAWVDRERLIEHHLNRICAQID
ncbi:TetR/AcrR family transcriptional regulator [Novosphingobium sp. KCTC 2891]|uniref:TetR/AcrR family transcriptional regulator n=1 Tax=Novosphingobium sp. KCTC 2891 TaxID=2989730 RepID=UPI00222176EB|nr:TetR/AcrR family transcriptional regulator [Novosphingobium sp. KCTC 2891]MCW1383134.1 TetR/AcrR family transcriptional regulator [Novosphingobium sp. KCTC 2891]